jgi:hypothetical protein
VIKTKGRFAQVWRPVESALWKQPSGLFARPTATPFSFYREQTGDTTMNRSLFRLLMSCAAVISIAFVARTVNGQTPLPFKYRVEYSNIINGLQIEDLVQVNDGINDGLYVVGYYFSDQGLARGFVYRYRYEDSQFFDMPILVGLDEPDFISCRCRGINKNGIVVASLVDANNLLHAVYFDLFEPGAPTIHSLNDQFSEIPPPTAEGNGVLVAKPWRINANGDILMTYLNVVVNPFSNSAYTIPGVSTDIYASDLNDLGTVFAFDHTSQSLFRYNIHDPNSLEFFPSFNWLGDPEINNRDEICALEYVYGRRNRVEHRFAVRYGSQVDWNSDPIEVTTAESINDSGDVCGEGYYTTGIELYLHYSSGTEIETGPTVDVQSLVKDGFFENGDLWDFEITNRIELSPEISAPIVCGGIRTRQTTDRRIFFLIPEELPPSSTYAKTYAPPIAIPDYNPANPQGVSSTINVSDDVTVTGLTVNVDITHPQPDSLLVKLYGPGNGDPVRLFNLSGNNVVIEFNGIGSMGDWTLEVYDTVKKKTGTLNGWSITIEH